MLNNIPNHIEVIIMQVNIFLLFALVTASITFYFMLLMRLKPSTEAKLSTFIEKENVKKKQKTLDSIESVTTQKPDESLGNETKEKECPHYVGYLTTLPKGSSFPEECFGCRKVIRCMRIEPAGVIESFYVGAAEPEGKSQ